MKFPKEIVRFSSSSPLLPSLLGRPLLHPYISPHETAIVSRSRPGCYELRSAPWYAYMHACMKYVCIRASRTVYAVVSDVSMEDGLRKDQRHLASLSESSVGPRQSHFIRQCHSVIHACMHALAQSSCSPWSRRYEIRCVVCECEILVFLFWNPWRARPRAVRALFPIVFP